MTYATRKKILFLITKSNWGGAQRYVFDLATNLPKDQFEVVVALGGDGVLIKMLKDANIEVIQINSLQRDISFLKELRSFFGLHKIIQNEKPDILHVNSSKAGLIGTFLGRVHRIPRIIFTAHGWAFNENRSLLQRLIFKVLHWLTVVFSHQTIAVSNQTKSQLRGPLITSKMAVIKNGRMNPNFQSRKDSRAELCTYVPKLKPHQGDIWIGTITELHPIKQHELAIAALSNIILDYPTVRYVIVGDGSEKEKLEALVKTKNLEDNVFFAGHINEAARFMKAFDIFTLTSKSEALGYVIIEAALSGTPIVATRVGGIPEIVTNDTHGYLIEDNDIQALATAYRKLIENDKKRKMFSENLLKLAPTFSLETMCKKTIALYQNTYSDPFTYTDSSLQ
ncbi:glycosyltransferase family 4 protein [Candidatus Pacebacteria bacterium]|nr:glycosyltransferase family 4 protein [Candidatus Paceibacterota bacterium]